MTTTEELTRQQADFGSQLTADNRSIEIEGETFVYRRFGNAAALAEDVVDIAAAASRDRQAWPPNPNPKMLSV